MNKIINEKLIYLEKTSEQYWNIPRESGNHLNLIIKAAGYKNILEIGTSNGYSGIWLAEAAMTNSGHVTTIEYYQERINLAQANFEECGLSNFITVLQGKALEVIQSLDEEYDFIFIDANKAEYIKYFNNLHTKLKKKGLLVADNVISHKTDMEDFLDLINNNAEYQVSCLPFGGGLLIGLKT